jgi:hypothetical protein
MSIIVVDTTTTRANTMQHKPKTGDLFDMGPSGNYKLVPLKAHRHYKRITILHEKYDGIGVAIDYPALVGGGVAFNGELGKRVKIWKIRGT